MLSLQTHLLYFFSTSLTGHSLTIATPTVTCMLLLRSEAEVTRTFHAMSALLLNADEVKATATLKSQPLATVTNADQTKEHIIPERRTQAVVPALPTGRDLFSTASAAQQKESKVNVWSQPSKHWCPIFGIGIIS